MRLHGHGVPGLSGDEGYLLKRQALSVAHADDGLISDGKQFDEEHGRFSVKEIKEAGSGFIRELKAFFREDVERYGFVLAIFVDDQIVEHVVEECLHGIDLASFYQVFPCLYESVLYQIFGSGAVVYLEKSVFVEAFTVVSMSEAHYGPLFGFFFRSHYIW